MRAGVTRRGVAGVALGAVVGTSAYGQPVYVGPVPTPAAPYNVSNYKGADAGRLVASTATTAFSLLSAGSVRVQVLFRRLDGPGEGRILAGLADPTFKEPAALPLVAGPELAAQGLSYSKRKYTGAVTSNVLPPGRYEATSVLLTIPQAEQIIGPFAIPFEIAPGRATYIGEFRALELWRKGFGIFAYNVVVTDQNKRDALLFKARHPEIGQVAVNVIDVSGLGVRFLSARP